MQCNFRVGQKVVAIKNHGLNPTKTTATPVRADTVLTIRAIQTAVRQSGEETTGLLFHEIRNEVVSTTVGPWELDYDARCFRPIVERGTNAGILILRHLLNKQNQTVREDA